MRVPVALRAALVLAASLILAGVLPSCGSGTDAPRASRPASGIIRVPRDAATIQAAVKVATSGDLILISPGTYHETVTVETAGLTLRGLDRNRVILDGRSRFENGIAVFSDDVVVENMTIRRYRSNGVFFTGDYGNGETMVGYRASYLTVANNGLYGVYAFHARGGTIDHIYASGHPDSGVYVGQCNPCDAVVTDVLAEFNAVGYQGTNSSGNLIVARSVWRNNRVGIEAISSTKEGLAPQESITFIGNVIADNAERKAPRSTEGFGVGIAISGGRSNHVTRNLITGHPGAGVAILDSEQFRSALNRVDDNTLSNNVIDLVDESASTSASERNCFTANRFASASPDRIETVLSCDATAPGAPSGALAGTNDPPDVDLNTIALPGDQPTMPNAARAPHPAPDHAPTLDLSTITTPTGTP